MPSSARRAVRRGHRDGVGDTPFVASASGAEGGGTGIPAGPDTTSQQVYGTSLVSSGTVRVLRAATVIDATRTAGLSADAVAGFAAMAAFAEIRAGAVPPDSILGLFAADPPGGVTAWDLGCLRALYRLPLDRDAVRQRGRLAADLAASVR